MRRLIALCLVAASLTAVAGCNSESTTSRSVVVGSIVTDSTAVIPGSCDPAAEALPAPTIEIDGTTTPTTFGIGAYECGTITGDGYIVFSFNPVLLDADAPIEVTINSDATAKLTWSLGEPFSESGDTVWTSAAPVNGCARLTIELTSPAGTNTATYGADIRVGGADVDCPQRVIDPSDPGDIGSVPENIPIGNGPPAPVTTAPTTTVKPGTTTKPGTTSTTATTTATTLGS